MVRICLGKSRRRSETITLTTGALPLARLDSLKDLLIIVPALHLFCCFLYLFCFYYSFGHGLIYFASPTEVFTVSIAEIAPVYVFGGLGMILGVVTRPQDNDDDSQKAVKRRPLSLWFWLIVLIAALSFATGVIASILSGYIFWDSFLIALVLVVSAIAGYLTAKYQVDQASTYAVLAISGAILIVAIRGLDDGQSLAKLRLDLDNLHAPTCGEYHVVKDVADRFLSVDTEQNRVLIDSKCEASFILIKGGEIPFDHEPNPFRLIYENVLVRAAFRHSGLDPRSSLSPSRLREGLGVGLA